MGLICGWFAPVQKSAERAHSLEHCRCEVMATLAMLFFQRAPAIALLPYVLLMLQ